MTRDEAAVELERMRSMLKQMIEDDVLPHSKADVSAHRAWLELTNVLGFFRGPGDKPTPGPREGR